MRHALPALLLLLVVSSGCATTVNQTPSTAGTPIPDANTPGATPTGVVEQLELASSGTACDDDLFVEWWGLNEEHLWQPDVVRVSYYGPPDTSFLLVTYVDGTVGGAAYENNTNYDGFIVDGAELDLDEPLSGEHVLQVVIYHDEDRNGQLDRDVDSPCLDDGAVVTTRPVRVDFSRFG